MSKLFKTLTDCSRIQVAAAVMTDKEITKQRIKLAKSKELGIAGPKMLKAMIQQGAVAQNFMAEEDAETVKQLLADDLRNMLVAIHGDEAWDKARQKVNDRKAAGTT